jgi:hypothetical protein
MTLAYLRFITKISAATFIDLQQITLLMKMANKIRRNM